MPVDAQSISGRIHRKQTQYISGKRMGTQKKGDKDEETFHSTALYFWAIQMYNLLKLY